MAKIFFFFFFWVVAKRQEVDQAISFQCFLKDCSANTKGREKICGNTGFLVPSFPLPSISTPALKPFFTWINSSGIIGICLPGYMVWMCLNSSWPFWLIYYKIKTQIISCSQTKINYRYVLLEEPLCPAVVICLWILYSHSSSECHFHVN